MDMSDMLFREVMLEKKVILKEAKKLQLHLIAIENFEIQIKQDSELKVPHVE